MELFFVFAFFFIFISSALMIGPFGKKNPAVKFFGWFWMSVALLLLVVSYVILYMIDWGAPG